ncbi:phospholipase D-like domain-containing protein [Fimbriiglobus ruber]|uniref:phospholipase D-like domain-containing protein n=1 Tax=Fimbriiglobus ruber TaxID=1908690 RepID=UPI001379B362|nr:phospholipase D-like domain-containing protein [Fimbriiglobus ruber]
MTRRFLTLILLSSPALADPSITVAFSPHAGATEAVVQVISEAKQTVHIAAYGFTSRPIAQALIQAHQRGAEVEIVLDKSNATARYSESEKIVAAGIPVRTTTSTRSWVVTHCHLCHSSE